MTMLAPSIIDQPIAQIITERLSDGSLAFNVVITGGTVIGALDQKHAEDIERALNAGSSWLQIPGSFVNQGLLTALRRIVLECDSPALSMGARLTAIGNYASAALAKVDAS